MGCGIPSVLLFLLPWQHIAFRTIGCIYLIFDSALFLAFSIMIITRYTLYPEIFPATLKHEQVSLLDSPDALTDCVCSIACSSEPFLWASSPSRLA